MAEEIAFEYGRISRLSRARDLDLDLDLDLGSGHTVYHRASLIDLYVQSSNGLCLTGCAEGNGTGSLMPGATMASNYYRGFPPPTSPYVAADSGRVSYGLAEDAGAVSGPHVRSPDSSSRRPSVDDDPAGVAETSAKMESDSQTSEDGDISVCSLDTTDVLLNTRQIEAS